MSEAERERARTIKALRALSDARFEIEMLQVEFGEKSDFLLTDLSKKLTEMMQSLGESRL